MQRVADESSSTKVVRANESFVGAVVDRSSSCSSRTSRKKGSISANAVEHEFLDIIQNNQDEVANIDDAKLFLEISKSGKLDPVSKGWLDRECSLRTPVTTTTEETSTTSGTRRSRFRRCFSRTSSKKKNVFDESSSTLQYFKSFGALYVFSGLIAALVTVCHLVVLDCWYSMEDYGEDMEGTYGKQDDVEVMTPRDVRYFWRKYTTQALIAVSTIQIVEEAGHVWASTFVYLEVLKLELQKQYLLPVGSIWIMIWLNRVGFISGFYSVALSFTKQQAVVLYEFCVGAIYVFGLHFFYTMYFWKAQAREDILGADKLFSRKLLLYCAFSFSLHLTLWACWVEIDPGTGLFWLLTWFMVVSVAIVAIVWNYTFDRDISSVEKRESIFLAVAESTGKEGNGEEKEDDSQQSVSNIKERDRYNNNIMGRSGCSSTDATTKNSRSEAPSSRALPTSRSEAPSTVELRFALKCNYLACRKQIVRLHIFEEGQYELNFVFALYLSMMFGFTYYVSEVFAYVTPSSKSLRIPVWHIGGVFIESLVYFIAERASGGSDAFGAASAFFAQLFFSICGAYMIFLLEVFSFEYFFAVALVVTLELYRDTFLHRHKHRFVVWCWSVCCSCVGRGEIRRGNTDQILTPSMLGRSVGVERDERTSCGRGDGFTTTSEAGRIAPSVTTGRSSTSRKSRNHGILSLQNSGLSIYQRFIRDVKADLVNCAFYWNIQSVLVEIFSAVTVLVLVIVEYIWMRNEMLERGPYYLAGLDIYTDYSKSDCQDSNSASCHGVNKLGQNSEHQFALKLAGLGVYLIFDFVQGCVAARINTRHLQQLFENWSKASKNIESAKVVKSNSSSNASANGSNINIARGVDKDASSGGSSSSNVMSSSSEPLSEEQEEILMSSVNLFCVGKMVTDLGYDHFMRFKVYFMLQVVGGVAISVGFTRVFRDPVIYV